MIRVIRIIHRDLQSKLLFDLQRKKKGKDIKQTHNLLLSTVVLVCESYIFCNSRKYRLMQWPNQQYRAYC